ncbi:MAG: AAA family ATPase [Candidatus Bathyarchaeota archaeon]|nr:AAA family ATPase [Candidatus Bathyarchaeota archaeon]
MLIREVILENFMSYEYARIPLKKGVNVVCGPNGAGKSTILLGISVALGQSSTERSKRLSDLIRYGKDEARVTIVLDNSPRNGKRPVSRIKKDQIFLTRNLRRDGKYWFELENTAANKADVNRLLSKFEVDPENMLIIMHQSMVNQFSVLSPQEKLRMVEAAVGFESYRKNVAVAQKKLSRILSQGDSVDKLLQSAEQTLSYWREQYDRYQQKKQMVLKRRFLERELAWAEVQKQEKFVEKIKEQNEQSQKRVLKLEQETQTLNAQLDEQNGQLKQARGAWKNLFEDRLKLEREMAKQEVLASTADLTIKESEAWNKTSQNEMTKFLANIDALETFVQQKTNPVDLRPQLDEIKASYESLQSAWAERFNQKSLMDSVVESKEQFSQLNIQIDGIKHKAESVNSEIEKVTENIIDQKIQLALLAYQKENLTKALKKQEKELQNALADLNEYVKKAEAVGARLVPMKTTMDILEELRVTDGHLAALSDVSENIERMYESYSKLYLELKEKARLVAENREKALQEVTARMDSWRNVIHKLLNKVNQKYAQILAKAYATGEVKLSNEEDLENAGLEILVGFKGSKPVPFNAYTQSGGERSTATVTFLLALQQHVHSPFRAVDEYDVHMDPKNRETIANLLVSSVAGSDSQYLAITPSQLTFTDKDIHLITVQNVEGASLIKEVT